MVKWTTLWFDTSNSPSCCCHVISPLEMSRLNQGDQWVTLLGCIPPFRIEDSQRHRIQWIAAMFNSTLIYFHVAINRYRSRPRVLNWLHNRVVGESLLTLFKFYSIPFIVVEYSTHILYVSTKQMTDKWEIMLHHFVDETKIRNCWTEQMDNWWWERWNQLALWDSTVMLSEMQNISNASGVHRPFTTTV